jgi:hypothetical protein
VRKKERRRERKGDDDEEKKLFNVQTSSAAHWVPGFFLINWAARA